MAQDDFTPDKKTTDDFTPDDFTPDKITETSSLLKGGLLDTNIPLKQRLMTVLEGPSKDTAGHELLGPGLMKIPGLETIGDYIRNKATSTGNYYVGAAGSIIGDLISGASTALDPRTTFPGHVPTELVRDIPLEPPSKPKELLGLPPAPREVERPTKFIAGPAGVAETGKTYPIDIGPIKPSFGEDATVLPKELEGLTQVQPDYAAREGLSLGRPALSESVKPTDLVRQTSNIGTTREPYQLPSAPVKPSRFFGPEAKASLDEINSTPKEPNLPVNTVLPEPGQATPIKDISGFTAGFTSPDITLSSRSITKPIADIITKAQDQKSQWIATTERELADLSSGLNKSDRIQLGQLIDGQDIPDPNPDLVQRASQARVILDNIHDMFPEGATRSGEDVGYLENYFTHIHQQPEDIQSAIQSIIDHHFGIFQAPEDIPAVESTSGIGDLYEKGLGKPSSPYVEPRQNLARNIQYDVNKVFPAYVESASKVIFDKPAVELAKKQLAKIPDSNLKELATWYIKNYTNYDSMPGLDRAWNSWASQLARTTSRSLLGWNTGLQTLHLARLVANMWPELGTKYSTIGLKEVATHPIAAWTEAAKLGLLQNEIRPFSFRTPMEKYDSISQFLSIADYLDKAIGYHGFKAKFLESGMGPEDASLAALKETKRVSQTVDPARQMMAFTPPSGGNPIGTAAVRLGAQFKQVPAKIVEQYINIARTAKDNPKAAARLISGVGLALAADQEMRTFHLSPTQMIPTGIWGAFGSTVTKVVNELRKGNWEGALMDTALWATPGGQSIKRQIQQGPSAFNP